MQVTPLMNITTKYNKTSNYSSKATVSFSAIKVKDENDKKEKVSMPTSHRRMIIDNLKFKFGIYKEQDELFKDKDFDEKIRRIGKNARPASFIYNGKKVFNAKTRLLKEQEPSLSKREENSEKLLIDTEQLPEEISKTDRKNDLLRQNKETELMDKYIDRSRKTGMSKIAGYETEQMTLFDTFIDKVKAEKNGEDIKIPSSILFFGPYRNGKTYITYAIAQEADCGDVVEIITNTESQSAQKKAMKTILDEAQKAEEKFQATKIRTIIFIDEITNLANGDSHILPELEDFLNNCSEKYHCTVFAATNHPLKIPFDKSNNRIFPIRFAIDPPDKYNASKMFEYYLNGITEGEVNNDELAEELINQGKEKNGRYNNKQIKLICDNAHAKKGNNLSQDDLLEYIKSLEILPGINSEAMEKFQIEFDTYIN